MALPAAAAAAYQNVARMAQAASSPGVVPAEAPGSSFSDFLSGAVKDSIANIRQGERPPPRRSPARPTLSMWSIR